MKLTRLGKYARLVKSQMVELIALPVLIVLLLHFVACAWCLLGQSQVCLSGA